MGGGGEEEEEEERKGRKFRLKTKLKSTARSTGRFFKSFIPSRGSSNDLSGMGGGEGGEDEEDWGDEEMMEGGEVEAMLEEVDDIEATDLAALSQCFSLAAMANPEQGEYEATLKELEGEIEVYASRIESRLTAVERRLAVTSVGLGVLKRVGGRVKAVRRASREHFETKFQTAFRERAPASASER